jgi:hypothetical protein
VHISRKSKSINGRGRKEFTCLPAGRRKEHKELNINILPLRPVRATI